jgi:2-oxoglutarate dehydrogenase E2 component (dihydrolipoamide succinyltransferase)
VTADVTEVVAFAARYSKDTGVPIGLPELLVAALARLTSAFPLCYAEVQPDGSLRLPEAAHIGVTVDIGTGLSVPVVHDAASLTLTDIADRLADYRINALREAFQPADLEGANIMLSLNNDGDVLVAQPLVFPGQTCAVSLGAVRTVAGFDADGTVVPVQQATIGIAYDHRAVNGRDAVEFLKAVKDALATMAATVEEVRDAAGN